ncbi:MAG: NUDIX hydrolase [Polyangiales bacterium]
MLDFDPNRVAVAPRPAATVILLRDTSAELEVCVMQRSNESSFMGGAVVFPGGRVEAEDARWSGHVVPAEGRWSDEEGTAARVAACREALEEVGIVLCAGAPPSAPVVASLRACTTAESLREAMAANGLEFDLSALHPLSRWVTPEAEKRRFDARFFLARAPRGQEGSIDAKEATRVFWASPRALLESFEAGEIALFPPTHRTLEGLAGMKTVEQAFEAAAGSTLAVICPRFTVESGNPILALPGDPLHEIRDCLISGPSRYVLRDAKWVSSNPV